MADNAANATYLANIGESFSGFAFQVPRVSRRGLDLPGRKLDRFRVGHHNVPRRAQIDALADRVLSSRPLPAFPRQGDHLGR